MESARSQLGEVRRCGGGKMVKGNSKGRVERHRPQLGFTLPGTQGIDRELKHRLIASSD